MRRIGFSVDAAHDMHITLAADDTFPSDSWEIVFGGWSGTKSIIRQVQQGDAVAVVEHTAEQFKKVMLFCKTSNVKKIFSGKKSFTWKSTTMCLGFTTRPEMRS